MELLLRRRMANSSGGESGTLPSGYTAIPYVSCNGSSYIDSGLYGDKGTVIETQFMVTGGGYTTGFFGSYVDQAANTLRISIGNSESSGVVQFLGVSATITIPRNTILSIRMDCNGVTGDINHSLTSGNNRTASTIHVGHVNGSYSASSASFIGKIYGFSIKENGVLMRHYVPAVRESDGVHGFYDTVNDTFNPSLGDPFGYSSFSGTATENFTVDIVDSDNYIVSTVSVTVTNGEFNTELPILKTTTTTSFSQTTTRGQRYYFGGRTAITSITQCPVIQLSCGRADDTFWNCTGLVSICDVNISDATSLTSMFEGCTSLVRAPRIRTNNVKLMNKMFYGCTSLTYVPEYNYTSILNSESSSISSLSSMFLMCPSLTTIAGMYGLQKDVNFRGCVNLSVDSLLNVANSVATNPKTGWSGYTPEIPPTVGGNDSGSNYLNIRLSGTAGSESAGDGSIRVRMYNDDSAKYTQAVTILANKGWIVNN